MTQPPLHETHTCEDCGAIITIPYVKPDQPPSGDALREAAQEVIGAFTIAPGVTTGRQAKALEALRVAALAASQPPSGDALREAARAVVDEWEATDEDEEYLSPDFAGKVFALRAALATPAPPTVEVNVTVNDQNVVAIGNEIRIMAPWLSENEIRRWSDRIAAVVAR